MSTALIVIDFINDIMNQESKIASCAEHCQQKQALQAANRAIAWAREQNHLVVFVKVGFDKQYHLQPKHSPLFGKAHQFGIFQLATWGTDFHPELAIEPDDLVIEKPRVNPFYATQLEAALRANHIEHLLLCGVSSTLAIQSAARDGHDRDYQITVLEDACAAHDEHSHQAAISLLTSIATISSTQDLPS